MKLRNYLAAATLLLSVSVFGQSHKISGTVSYGDVPINGLRVAVQGSKDFTTTDAQGHYSIDLGKQNVLVFSGDGIISEYVTVKKKQTELNVKIGVSDIDLAVAKGLLEKQKISNQRAFVKPADKVSGTLNLKDMIESQVPGVIYKDGYVYIRGERCALYLVDGARTPSLEMLDPGSVQKIEVVKDGTASVYGGDAYNGVVLVTTKK